MLRAASAADYKSFIAMNKTELVNTVASQTGIARSEVRTVVDSCFDTIIATLENDGKVALAGFGTFSVTEKSPRSGYNPHSGERIDIPARKAVRFKAGANIDNRVR
jgi:DNA-binding protein HU-beta